MLVERYTATIYTEKTMNNINRHILYALDILKICFTQKSHKYLYIMQKNAVTKGNEHTARSIHKTAAATEYASSRGSYLPKYSIRLASIKPAAANAEMYLIFRPAANIFNGISGISAAAAIAAIVSYMLLIRYIVLEFRPKK